MADDLEHLHIDAGLGPLRAQAAIPTFPDAEGNAPTPLQPPYRRVYTAIERPVDGQANALDGRSATWVTTFYIHHVGKNEYACAALAMQTRIALLDLRPVIAGRSCGMFRQDASQPTQRDESTGTAVFDRLDVYSFVSGPG